MRSGTASTVSTMPTPLLQYYYKTPADAWIIHEAERCWMHVHVARHYTREAHSPPATATAPCIRSGAYSVHSRCLHLWLLSHSSIQRQSTPHQHQLAWTLGTGTGVKTLRGFCGDRDSRTRNGSLTVSLTHAMCLCEAQHSTEVAWGGGGPGRAGACRGTCESES